MISAIIFLNEKGESVLVRNYRGDVRRSSTEAFRNAIIVKKNTKYPIVQIGTASFFWIREQNVYIIACANREVNASVVFESLHRLVTVFKAYFHGLFNEEKVHQNAGLIYELLDEAFDFGYPQIIDPEILKSYILQGKPITTQKAKEVSVHATGVSTRPPNIHYSKNELFIDVIEQVNLLVSSKRTILNAEVEGQIALNVRLSGEPECIFGFNDKLFLDAHAGGPGRRRGPSDALELDDMKFHQCVKLGRFNADRTIAFVPPDGEFVLMRYRVSDRVIKPPFNVVPVIIEYSRTRFIVQITVSSTFSAQFVATQVAVTIPLPNNTAKVKTEVTVGSTKYEPTQHAVVWKIKNFPGSSSTQLTANVQLLASVPMATSSGLEVLFMNVNETKQQYHADRFIRYVTRGGNYLIRYPDNVASSRDDPRRTAR